MKIKIKNIKSLKELEYLRHEKINDEVLKFLGKNGYRTNALAKDPLTDLVDRVHKDDMSVMVDTRNERLNKNPVNGRFILTFDLIIYFVSRSK